MGKYYKTESSVFFFEDDQLDLVTPTMQLMTEVEIDRHLNPVKYLTAQERSLFEASLKMPINKVQLKLALLSSGKLLEFEAFIASIQDPTEKLKAEITYTDSVYFNRLDTFIITAFTALGFTSEDLNSFWEKAASI